jgi:hypothetical protein
MIKIIDDFLPEILFEHVYNVVMDEDYPWFFLKDTTYRSKYDNTNLAQWDEGFSSLIYYKDFESEKPKFTCPSYEAFVPMLMHCELALDLKMSNLARVKANLNTTSLTTDPFEPHIDQPDMAMDTAILYLNDSDGPTYIYDFKCPIGYSTNQALEFYRKYKDDCKILTTIPPKRNRMLVFDGNYYHSGSRPVTHKARYNLNLNWFAESPINRSE